jgi:hypothetical protein
VADHIEWARPFEVWQYSVRHSTLMLRSLDFSVDPPSRVDVVFANVHRMYVRSGYDSLSVVEYDPDVPDPIFGVASENGAKMFVINSGEGFVEAGGFAWHEDSGDHHAPSYFGPIPGTE